MKTMEESSPGHLMRKQEDVQEKPLGHVDGAAQKQPDYGKLVVGKAPVREGAWTRFMSKFRKPAAAAVVAGSAVAGGAVVENQTHVIDKTVDVANTAYEQINATKDAAGNVDFQFPGRRLDGQVQEGGQVYNAKIEKHPEYGVVVRKSLDMDAQPLTEQELKDAGVDLNNLRMVKTLGPAYNAQGGRVQIEDDQAYGRWGRSEHEFTDKEGNKFYLYASDTFVDFGDPVQQVAQQTQQ